jgi:hypothetical protein
LNVRYRRAITVAGVALAAGAVLGCGSSPEPQLSETATSRLHHAIADVRSSTATRDKTKALNALTVLSRLVNDQASAGHLASADTAAMRTAIAQTRRRISVELPTAATTQDAQPPAPATAPAITPPPPPAVIAAPQPSNPPVKHGKPGKGDAKNQGAKSKGKPEGHEK